MDEKTSTLERMSDAIGSVGLVEKDKKNSHFGYDYLSEEAVKKIAARVCAQYRVTPQSIAFEILKLEEVPAKAGTAQRCIIRCELRWSEHEFVHGLGCGIDAGDKAIMKAQTAAIREAWKARLCIATGHDPEASREVDAETETDAPPSQPITEPENTRHMGPHMLVPFGKYKGQHISDIDDVALNWLAAAYEKNLHDPSKSKYHQAELQRLDAVREEQRARAEYSPADGYQASRDDIPF